MANFVTCYACDHKLSAQDPIETNRTHGEDKSRLQKKKRTTTDSKTHNHSAWSWSIHTVPTVHNQLHQSSRLSREAFAHIPELSKNTTSQRHTAAFQKSKTCLVSLRNDGRSNVLPKTQPRLKLDAFHFVWKASNREVANGAFLTITDKKKPYSI